jgi:hypothetical protein
VNTAFFIVFGLFVVAMIGLAVMAVRWSVGRDRLARTAQAAETEPTPRPTDRPTKDDR